MLTHSEDTSVKYTAGGKPSEALGLGNPTLASPSRAQLPPCAVMKGEKAPLRLASFVYLPSELHPAPLGPCSNVFCYVSFQTEYLCVWSRPCLANTCTHSRTHTPIQLSPCARGPLCPSPLL